MATGWPCLRQEYDNNLPSRILESNLSVGGLVTAIFALTHHDLAVKFPARIAGTTHPLNGMVEVVLLDEDLYQDSEMLEIQIGDGIILNHVDLDPLGASDQGYFMGYEDAFMRGLEKSGMNDIPLALQC